LNVDKRNQFINFSTESLKMNRLLSSDRWILPLSSDQDGEALGSLADKRTLQANGIDLHQFGDAVERGLGLVPKVDDRTGSR
jgi:hypothetical protein